MLRYVEGRNTEDVDLVLSAASLQALPEISVTDREGDFARGRFGSLRVDVLLSSNPVFKLVHERYVTTHDFHEIEVRCATVEGLLLLKLYALPALYRQGDSQRITLYEADITMLMARYRPDLKPLFASLQPHVDPGAWVELQNIIADIEKRIARIDQARKQ